MNNISDIKKGNDVAGSTPNGNRLLVKCASNNMNLQDVAGCLVSEIHENMRDIINPPPEYQAIINGVKFVDPDYRIGEGDIELEYRVKLNEKSTN